MKLFFDSKLADAYHSPSQRARVLTESWVDEFVFCPNCGNADIEKYANNRPVADFFCPNCDEQYELKSKRNSIGSKIVDGAYDTMIKRLRSSNNPSFFFLNYNLSNLKVLDFLVIPKHFFTPNIIEKRKPLAPTAERRDWVGCNIVLKSIPQTGKIFLVKGGEIISKKSVLTEWQKTLFLRDEKEQTAKGWLLDVMMCLEKLKNKEFSLSEIYAFENELKMKHPENRHIKDKIRQQLQILRDKDYLDFISPGYYCLI